MGVQLQPPCASESPSQRPGTITMIGRIASAPLNSNTKTRDRLSRCTGNRHAVLASYGERERENAATLSHSWGRAGWREEGSQNRETGTTRTDRMVSFRFSKCCPTASHGDVTMRRAASTCFVLRFAARYHMRRNRNLEYFLFIISSSQFGLIPRY